MSSKAKTWTSCAVVTVVIAIVLLWMNSGYDKLSEKGYHFSMALISICNREDAERLAVLSDQIAVSVQAGELQDYDARVLLDITDRAAAGQWQAAYQRARRLMQNQVEP